MDAPKPFSLSRPERRLVKSAAHGLEADMRHDGRPRESRVIRAEKLRDLCTGTGHEGDRPVRDGIHLAGARVTGHLDLSGAELVHAVHFRDCVFEEPVNLRQATTHYMLEWTGGSLPGVMADRFETDADLVMRGVTITGPVSLHWAQVAGDLCFTDSHLTQPDGQTIKAPDLRVGGTLFLDGKEFRSEGEVNLRSAGIAGDVDCRHGHFDNPAGKTIDASQLLAGGDLLLEQDFHSHGEVCLQWAQVHALRATHGSFDSDTGYAIHADALHARVGVYLNQRFHARATVRLVGARITGELCCTDGRFDDPSGRALDAERVVADDIYIDGGFRAHGEVRLVNAEVKRQLNAARAVLHNPAGHALNADGLKCHGEIYLTDRFRAIGEVSLVGAEVQSGLICTDGHFTNHSRTALFADGLTTPGMVYLDGDFTAEGRVRLARATIGRQLICTGGVFDNQHGSALDLTGLRCAGDVLLRRADPGDDGFRATGEITLRDAQITRDLNFTGASLHGDEGVIARGMHVGGRLIWQLDKEPEGLVDLSFAHLSRLDDTPESWPKLRYRLAGTTFQSVGTKMDVEQRKTWLDQTELYYADVYRQVADQYHLGGEEESARKVHIASQRSLYKRGELPWHTKVWNRFLDFTVGYGYRLHRPFLALLALGLIGWGLFYWGSHAHLIVAAKAAPGFPPPAAAVAPCQPGYPCFNAFVYSFSLLIPGIDLREAAYWLPNAGDRPWGTLLMVYMWIMILAGWVAGTSIAAGVTRFFRTR
ncbi:MAG TPA: hypothetical protein VFU43_14820 [Streptosporangiaceae bacterium]|nr:hypothetical protein [Streptosporangiaceae bacterium]